jgi:hypothetical protein
MGGLSAIREIEEYKYLFFFLISSNMRREGDKLERLERKREGGVVLRQPYLCRPPLD